MIFAKHEPWSVGSILDGVQYVFKFDNGYGASVVRHSLSYGGHQGLYALAVLGIDDEICYTTHITDDVIGYLTEDDVEKLLKQIKDL